MAEQSGVCINEEALALLGRDHRTCTDGVAAGPPQTSRSDWKQSFQHIVGHRQASKKQIPEYESTRGLLFLGIAEVGLFTWNLGEPEESRRYWKHDFQHIVSHCEPSKYKEESQINAPLFKIESIANKLFTSTQGCCLST